MCSLFLVFVLVLVLVGFGFLFEDDFVIHALHAEDHENADADDDVHEDHLEVDPGVQLAELIWHLGLPLVIEVRQVDNHTNTEEVVHF